jgi:hypothetical protein
VVAELHRNAHLLKKRDGLSPEVMRNAVRGVVEVPVAVDRHRLLAGHR